MQVRIKKVSRLQTLVMNALEEAVRVPPYEKEPDTYTDWGLTGPYKVKTARGECAA